MSDDSIRLLHPLARDVSVRPEDVWTFPEGLLGVSDLRRFALVALPDADPFQLLCSAGESAFGIVLVDPAQLVPDYVLSLSPEELRPIGETDPERMMIRVPVRLPASGSPMSLNLKGPILLSTRERVGVQRISPDDAHAVRFVPKPAGTGATSCSS